MCFLLKFLYQMSDFIDIGFFNSLIENKLILVLKSLLVFLPTADGIRHKIQECLISFL